jgi:hypothetical protein
MRGLIVTVALVGFANLIDSLYFGGAYSRAANQILTDLLQHLR